MNAPLKNISQIRDAMLKHFEDDKDSFTEMENRQKSIQDGMDYQKHLLADLKDSIDKLAADSAPVNQWFKNVTYTKVTILWIVGFIGTIVAIAIGIKSLFTK